ncbi:MAG: MBOAT family protein [Eubacterium sp.]|nr:MBOAT family protein [Eubacterium sp.]
MVFSSLIFLVIFLPITLLVYYIAPTKLRNLWLLIVSLIFYSWGEPVYILLMLFSILLNYVSGLLISSTDESKTGKRKALLAISVAINVGLLFVFKYADFTIGTYNVIFGKHVHLLNIALPIGISFYTFQAMSYVIDVYRGKVQGNKNIINFATYITMFPQLIAGPIVRYKTVEKELRDRKCTVDDFYQGIIRFTIGLGKKVLIANNVAVIFKEIAAKPAAELSTSLSWLAVLAFTLQIYFDFSGYSDMAIGMGRMLGFHFLENFDYPYESKSITEFWRRWHISLSTWFKEYVYIPLGGNRKGLPRQILNIFIVWLLTGFWHGASWNFVLWGVYYAILLIIEKLFLRKFLDKLPSIIGRIYTIAAFVSGWAIFVASDLKFRGSFIKALFFNANLGVVDKQTAYYLLSFGVLLVVGIIGATSIPKRVANKLLAKNIAVKSIVQMLFVVVILALSIAFIVSDTYNPFLYFRF